MMKCCNSFYRLIPGVLAVALCAVSPASASSANSPPSPAVASSISDVAATFVGLTTPQATAARVITPGDKSNGHWYYGPDEGDRWNVTNHYLPGDRNFFSMIYGSACAADGTLFVAANSVVSVNETGRPPRSNRDWYADNGQGIWRVEPDGRVTAFSVRAYGNQPGRRQPTAVCNVDVVEAAHHQPDRWGGLALAPNGDIYVSDKEYHMILKLRSGGYVEHVAGGGEKACGYDPWKDKKESGYRDGPGRQALFRGPRGLAFDRQGNLLVADPGNCALRRIDPSGNVTTVRKDCKMAPDDVGKPEKWINYIHVVIDPQDRPVVGGSRVAPSVDIYSNIHRLHPDGRVEQLLSASKGYANSGRLRLEYLSGLAYLPDGTLLIADPSNNLLRELNGTRLSDWLGSASDSFDTDVNGPAAQARLRQPGGLGVAGDGTVFVTPDKPRSSPLRKVDGKTRAVSTWLY